MTNYVATAKLNASMMNKVNAISICINSKDYIFSLVIYNTNYMSS